MTAAKVQAFSSSTAEIVADLPVSQLILSPTETRKTVDDGSLAELAKSIGDRGVIENLLVRPIGLEYEIVSGQRRWLASKLAGKKTCPCIIREMSDNAAAELRIISNLQRENLAPMEEAEGLGELVDRHGATIESVAAAVGKSSSYVGRRLKLLDAIVPVREALKAGAIEVAHALELARLAPIQQARFLDELRCGYEVPRKNGSIVEAAIAKSAVKAKWTPTGDTVGALRGEIARTQLRVLSEAPFPLDSTTLHPGPCLGCPKRSGNNGMLFSDLTADTCTDRSCFDRKVQAFIVEQLELARKEKRVLLRLSDNYSSEKDVIRDYDVTVIKGASCGHADQAIRINGDDAGKITLICRGGDCKTHGRQSLSDSSTPAKSSPERKQKLAKVNAERKFRRALFDAIAKQKLDRTMPHFPALVQLGAYAISRSNSQYFAPFAEALGWDKKLLSYDAHKKLAEQLSKLSQVEVVRAALLASESSELMFAEYSTGKADGLLALAKFFGVDAAKVRKQAEAPATTKPAAKPASKTPILSKEAKKRIAEAQRKRWAAAKKGGRK